MRTTGTYTIGSCRVHIASISSQPSGARMTQIAHPHRLRRWELLHDPDVWVRGEQLAESQDGLEGHAHDFLEGSATARRTIAS